MAISKINSKSIEDLQVSADDLANGTVTGAKLSYPLTTFSSTGIDDNATSTSITIDSSQNVGIGISSPNTKLDVAGDTTITKNDTPLYLNRTSTDGEIVRFSKDGTSNGQIATLSGKMYIGTGNANFRFRDDLTAIIPANSDGTNSDNDLDLGYSTVRWRRLYLSEGAYLGGTGTANLLDDYEEGTWTPTAIGDTSGDYTVGGGAATGAYTKIGRMVTVSGEIHLTAKNSPVGQFAIGNLPFSCANLTELAERTVGSVTTKYIDYDADCVSLATYIYAGETKFYLVQVRDNNNTLFTDCTAVESGDEIIFTFTYPTDS